MQGTIVTGCIADASVFERWDSHLGQDHAEYLTYIDIAQSNKSDIGKVFPLIAGSKTTYVPPYFNVHLWDAHAPSVTVHTCTPEDIPQVYSNVRSTLGYGRHSIPPAASAAFAHPSSMPPVVPPSLRLLPTQLSVRLTYMPNWNWTISLLLSWSSLRLV